MCVQVEKDEMARAEDADQQWTGTAVTEQENLPQTNTDVRLSICLCDDKSLVFVSV